MAWPQLLLDKINLGPPPCSGSADAKKYFIQMYHVLIHNSLPNFALSARSQELTQLKDFQGHSDTIVQGSTIKHVETVQRST